MKINVRVYSSIDFEKHQVDLLYQNGIHVSHLQMMAINYKRYESINFDINSITDVMVFTSQHGVGFMLQLIKDGTLKSDDKKCFAIQGTTSELLKETNFNVLGLAKDSESLADIIIDQKIQKVVHITTAWRLPIVEKKLKYNHIGYKALEVYNKVVLHCSVDAYDALVFSSPSHIDSFLLSNKLSENIPCFCIGSTTENYLIAKGHKHTIKAAIASKESLTEALIQFYSTKTTNVNK
jgi:uroporphyrinogen-III synthase